MKFDRLSTYVLIILFSILVNTFPIFNLKLGIFQEVISFIYLLTIPGLLIFLALKLKITNNWEKLVYIIGFSISFLMLIGLFINSVFPFFGLSNPLSYIPASTTIHVVLLLIGILGFIRNNDLKFYISLVKLDVYNTFFFVLPLLFPILSAMGAISLNNGGTNIFTMMLLGFIAIYVILLIVFSKRLNTNIYPYSLFLIALSVLLMTSLRGWYTTGHDNQQEYYVFLLTDSIKYWNIELFRDTYNACLSLNIFPTLLNSFMESDTLYIFKLYFQILFSILPIGVYLLIKKYTTKQIAYLSAFFIIAFPTFGNDMPMLNRQEIAFIFFILALLILFNDEISKRMKTFIFITFSISLILAHYSTSYIATTLFASVFALSFFSKIIFSNFKLKLNILEKYSVNIIMIIVTVAFTILWNFVITKTTNGLADVVNRTVGNIGNSFNQELKSSDTRYNLFNWSKPNKAQLLSQYIEEEERLTQNNIYKDAFFEKSNYSKYPIVLSEEEKSPLTKIGSFFEMRGINPFQIHDVIKQGSAKLIQLIIVIGFVIMSIFKSKDYSKINIEYLLFSSISIVLLALFVLLPVLSNSYGMLRFFLQTLMFLSFPLILGFISFFKLLKFKSFMLWTTVIIIFFFLSFYGFIPQLTGGFYPTLNLNNKGNYFDVLYTHKSDVLSVKWLEKQDIDGNITKLQASESSSSRILPLFNFKPLEKLLPSSIERNSYVYFDYLNNVKNSNSLLYHGETIYYLTPVKFFNENKNLIYNNGESVIYK